MESTVTGLDRNRYSHRRDIVNFCTIPNDITRGSYGLMIVNNLRIRKYTQKKCTDRRKSTLLILDSTLEKGISRNKRNLPPKYVLLLARIHEKECERGGGGGDEDGKEKEWSARKKLFMASHLTPTIYLFLPFLASFTSPFVTFSFYSFLLSCVP